MNWLLLKQVCGNFKMTEEMVDSRLLEVPDSGPLAFLRDLDSIVFPSQWLGGARSTYIQ